MSNENSNTQGVMGGGNDAWNDAWRYAPTRPQTDSANKPKVAPGSDLAAAEKLLAADREHRSLAADQVLMLRMVMPYFTQSVDQLSQGLFEWNRHQGFWPEGWIPGEWNIHYMRGAGGASQMATQEYVRMKKAEKIALIHSELGEMLEAVRKGDLDNEAEELADVLIRVLDYAGGFNIGLATAMGAKQIENYNRPHRHGKEF
jgi:NTP pyrophosphatase (non-canonical NTP hydrolase)